MICPNDFEAGPEFGAVRRRPAGRTRRLRDDVVAQTHYRGITETQIIQSPPVSRNKSHVAMDHVPHPGCPLTTSIATSTTCRVPKYTSSETPPQPTIATRAMEKPFAKHMRHSSVRAPKSSQGHIPNSPVGWRIFSKFPANHQ